MKPQRLVFSLILSIAYLFSSTAALNSAFAASSETDPPETSTDPCSTPNSQDPRCVLDPMVVTATRAPKDESNSMSEAEVFAIYTALIAALEAQEGIYSFGQGEPSDSEYKARKAAREAKAQAYLKQIIAKSMNDKIFMAEVRSRLGLNFGSFWSNLLKFKIVRACEAMNTAGPGDEEYSLKGLNKVENITALANEVDDGKTGAAYVIAVIETNDGALVIVPGLNYTLSDRYAVGAYSQKIIITPPTNTNSCSLA